MRGFRRPLSPDAAAGGRPSEWFKQAFRSAIREQTGVAFVLRFA
ncbi:hypothetical protein HMPREF9120_02462 [Neisseria sp. oral taxon 020 str. F0370]|nr:hypothetical protein HMPREF9120_02462 [Neisseria sp. oral taxon 020 str. F0370]